MGCENVVEHEQLERNIESYHFSKGQINPHLKDFLSFWAIPLTLHLISETQFVEKQNISFSDYKKHGGNEITVRKKNVSKNKSLFCES